jgi:hypothetical protein
MATMSRRHVYGRERTRKRLVEELLDKMLALPDPDLFRAVAAAEEIIEGSPDLENQEDADA